jgi:Zn-dependent protease with chaperone function
MMKLKRIVIVLSLCAIADTAPAQQPQPQQQGQTQVQDGITVRKLSVFRHAQPPEVVDQQSQQQYMQLMSAANDKGALLPSNHPEVVRLRTIAKRIIPHSSRWNQDAANWRWQVNVLDSPQVNAFCMPGGRIAFYSGILTTLRLTDDEVAAVMGHEIAHALREHSRAQAGKQMATSVFTRLAGAGIAAYFGIDPRITSTGADMVTAGVGLKFSRDDEREADLVGLDISSRAGFDPRAGIALWQKMGALNKRTPLALLSTHPGGDERITLIQNNLKLLMPLYAKSQGMPVDRLPPYRTVAALH